MLPLPDLFGFEIFGCYHCCGDNERAALANRHLMNTNAENMSDGTAHLLFQRFNGTFLDLMATRVSKLSEEEFLARCTPRLRTKYRKALESVRISGLTEKDARVKMFVKYEKDPQLTIRDKCPRGIQYRNPRYTATLACWLRPVEDVLFKSSIKGVLCPVEDRVFAKGLNSYQVASRLRAMQKWSNTVWILLDHSRFDAHVVPALLRAEHAVYNRVYVYNEELKRLLAMQLFNKGRTKCGIKYRCKAKKMSGEYNTSLGDSIINLAMLMRWTEGTSAEILVNGDDSVIAVSEDEFDHLDMGMFDEVGFTTKVEVTRNFANVEFCQCKPVPMGDGTYRMIRNPYRTVSKGVCTTKKYPGVKTYQRLLSAMGTCELACNDGVPVLQSFASYLLRHGKGATPIAIDDWYEWRVALEPRARKPQPREISQECRAGFSISFGIDVVKQIALENYFDTEQHDEYVSMAEGL